MAGEAGDQQQSGTAGGAGEQQGQQQQDGGQGGTGEQQQGTGGDTGSLLEADADDLNGGGTGEQGGEQQGGGNVDLEQIVGALEERLGARFDAIADRRVNAILREVRGGGQQGGQQQQQGGGDSGQQQQSAPAPSGADLRGARLAFREYVSDEVRFISAEERAFAMDLGAALLSQQAQQGIDDEDRVGRSVASEVAKRVKGLRKHYEDRTVAALKKRGALVEQPGQQSRQQGGGGVGAQSAFEKGAAMAAARFGQQAGAGAQQ